MKVISLLLLSIALLSIVGLTQPLKKTLGERLKLKEGYILLQDNSVVAVSPVYFPHKFVYASLINCLEWEESRNNPNAFGKAGEIGCLQFLPSTFKAYCEGDIWNCKDQRVCCDKMLQENWENINQWTTANRCLKGR